MNKHRQDPERNRLKKETMDKGQINILNHKITNTSEAFKKPRGHARKTMMRGKWGKRRRNNNRKHQKMARFAQKKNRRQSRSEATVQVVIYQLPMCIDGLAGPFHNM